MARGKGEGSIYQRSDGRWVAQVEAGRSPAGRRRYARAVRRTRQEAQAALRELQRNADAGVTPDRTSTVAAYLEWWLANVLPGTVRESTAELYAKNIRLYVIPNVGTVRLAKLTPAHVMTMLRRLEADGKAPLTRRHARAVLVKALGWAERTGMVTRNVAALVDGPRYAGTDAGDKMTATEAAAVITAASRHRLGALAVLVLRRGLRQGEALALRWSDVDLDSPPDGELTVRGTLKRRTGHGLYVDQPKTAAGQRTIPLGAELAAALAAHRKAQLEERLAAGGLWVDTGHVFTTARGLPVDPREASRYWGQWCDDAGVPRRRFHAARHTCATLLLEQGVPLEVVSAILGHSSLAITMDVYGRIGMDAKRRALTSLDQAIAGD